MYLDPEVKRTAEAELGKTLPNPDDSAFDDLILDLQHSNPELARTLSRAVIFEGVGDPRHDALIGEKRQQVKQGLTNAVFMRREEYSGEPVLSKIKVALLAVIVLVAFFGSGYWLNRPKVVAAQGADTQAAQQSEDDLPAADAVPLAVSPTATVGEPNMMDEVRQTLTPEPTTPPPPAEPAQSTQPPPPSAAASTGEPTQSGVVSARTPQGVASAVVMVREPSQAFVRGGEAAAPRSAVVKGGGRAASSSVVKGNSAAPGPSSSVILAQGANLATDNVTSGSDASLEQSTAEQPQPYTQAPTQLAGAQAATGQAQTQPDISSSQPPSLYEQPATTQNQATPTSSATGQYTVGDTVEGETAVGFLAAEGNALPAIIETSDGAVWRGQATLNSLARVEVTLTQVSVNGQTADVSAAVYGLDDYPGVEAEISEETPALAADLVTTALRGVTDYVQDLSENRSITSTDNALVIDEQVVPLEWAVAGSVAELFSPPRAQRALVRVAKVPEGTPLKVVVLN